MSVKGPTTKNNARARGVDTADTGKNRYVYANAKNIVKTYAIAIGICSPQGADAKATTPMTIKTLTQF